MTTTAFRTQYQEMMHQLQALCTASPVDCSEKSAPVVVDPHQWEVIKAQLSDLLIQFSGESVAYFALHQRTIAHYLSAQRAMQLEVALNHFDFMEAQRLLTETVVSA